MATELPAVLTFPDSAFSGISVYRALKHARQVILTLEPEGPRSDEVQVALDDLELMLSSVR